MLPVHQSKGKIFFFGGKVEGDTLSYNNELKVIQLKDEEAEWTPVVVTGEKPQGQARGHFDPDDYERKRILFVWWLIRCKQCRHHIQTHYPMVDTRGKKSQLAQKMR